MLPSLCTISLTIYAYDLKKAVTGKKTEFGEISSIWRPIGHLDIFRKLIDYISAIPYKRKK